MGPARRLLSDAGRDLHGPARVCGLPNVTVSDGQIVALVIDWHEAGFDFADAFHLALSRGQEAMKTFDAGFIKNAKKLTDRRVERP